MEQKVYQLLTEIPTVSWGDLSNLVSETNHCKFIKEIEKYEFEIYTDGASKGNGKGKSGWGFAIFSAHEPINKTTMLYSEYDGEMYKTNVRMEMLAYYRSLCWLNKKPKWKATIYVDNDLVVKTMHNITAKFSDKTGWKVDYADSYIGPWKKLNWRRGKGEIANLDLWKNIDKEFMNALYKGCEIKTVWVKGHSSNMGNQIADEMANNGCEKC